MVPDCCRTDTRNESVMSPHMTYYVISGEMAVFAQEWSAVTGLGPLHSLAGRSDGRSDGAYVTSRMISGYHLV